MGSDFDLSIDFPNFLKNFSVNPFYIAEGFLFLTLLVYLIYSFLVVRQVYIMSETITTPVSFVLKAFSWLHLLALIVLIIFTAVYLF